MTAFLFLAKMDIDEDKKGKNKNLEEEMKDNEITMEEKENKEKKKFTGKPSIDHPHWQWYPEEIYLAEVPKLKAYDYMKQRNEAYLNDVVLRYFGRKNYLSRVF